MRRHSLLISTLFLASCGGASEPVTDPAADSLAAVSRWAASASSDVPLTPPLGSEAGLPAVRSAAVGARMIGIGEATHGTHEFQLVQRRVLQTLVLQGGVSMVLTENNLAASRDLDAWVRGGPGSGAALLRLLYATPSNTQEMLDLLTWLHDWNATQPAAARVAVGGMDLTFASAAMDSVRAYASRTDSGFGAYVATAYDCFVPYNAGGGSGSLPRYSTAPDSVVARCSAAAQAVADSFAVRATGAAGGSEVAWAARYAQLVRQWERYTALTPRDVNTATVDRDGWMAENALWFAAQAGATSRVIVFAHDYHISRQSSTMGGAISAALGAAYLPLATDFDQGSFNAISPTAPTSFAAQRIGLAPQGSYEEGFRGCSLAACFLDLRGARGIPMVTPWLDGPRTMRRVGIGYDSTHPTSYDVPISLRGAFDGVFFVQSTTPTTLLP